MRNDAYEPITYETEVAAREVVDAAYKVHSGLGPGLLEGVYEVCLCYELGKRNISFKNQIVLPVIYDGLELDAGLRCDVIVNDSLIIEIKAVDKMIPVHEAQLLTYLKLTGIRLGLLINFNVPKIKDGIKRIVL
ncbi:MAG: GxxExxY protein [Deltaproteobacteria bacterium]|nr:GxxExxY protein [Candidatus Zymogenaceae bacterium]